MRPESAPAQPDLGRLQHWMQEVVVHPGTTEEALAAPGPRSEIAAGGVEDLVLPSHSMTAAERIGVYHDMYLLRMEEALATDYPVIRYELGDHQFGHLVAEYVQAHPSRSYTLNRLGDHLPGFFRDRPEWPRAAFLHELARLELAMTEVFDEAESPVLGADDLAAVPADAWEHARLEPVAAFRLVAFSYTVLHHLEAYHQDRPSPSPRRRATWLALYRRDYAVRRLELSRPQHALLAALADGTPLGDALATAAAKLRTTRQQQEIFRWFREWVAAGVFAAIEF